MDILNKKRASSDDIPDRIFIYESELDYISRCILDYPNTETGGNLFGSFTKNGIPIIEYVIGPGKAAIHRDIQFQQEKKYLKDVYDYISESFALSEIGAWHSHHQLDLAHPSGGDMGTVLKGLKKSGLKDFIIVIGNFTPPQTPINAFIFRDNQMNPYQSAKWIVLKEISPFRKVIDQRCEGFLLHPKTLKGNYGNKQPYVFKKQHWLSDKNNAKELMNIINFIKQKTDNVKMFHPEKNEIIIDIHIPDKNINIVFPSEFPSDPSYLIKISNKEGELICKINESVDISTGISNSIIQNLINKNIL